MSEHPLRGGSQGREILSFVDGYVAWQPGAAGAAGAAGVIEEASLVHVTGFVRWVAENRSELEVS